MRLTHLITLAELETCANAHDADVCLVGNVRAGAIVEALHAVARLSAIARFWKHRFMNTDQYTQDCTCPTCQTLTEETAEVPE